MLPSRAAASAQATVCNHGLGLLACQECPAKGCKDCMTSSWEPSCQHATLCKHLMLGHGKKCSEPHCQIDLSQAIFLINMFSRACRPCCTSGGNVRSKIQSLSALGAYVWLAHAVCVVETCSDVNRSWKEFQGCHSASRASLMFSRKTSSMRVHVRLSLPRQLPQLSCHWGMRDTCSLSVLL